MRLYFEQANFGKYIAWCDNWCVLVEADDVGTALKAVYLQRHEQLIEEDETFHDDEYTAETLDTDETSK